MPSLAKALAVCELMRLANVFTAVSNVWMGMILTTGGLPGWLAVGITATSCLLYLAGMVLNDLFDHEIDTIKRPARPIPSGRVSLAFARRLGWSLLALGVVTGWMTAFIAPTFAPGIVATMLTVAIVLYDAGLKKTSLGPPAMAFCRACNVALGMSLVAEYTGVGWVGAGYRLEGAPMVALIGIGMYVFGVSWFARSEAGESRRRELVFSAIGAMAGLAIICAMPFLDAPDYQRLRIQTGGWCLLWAVVAATILRRMVVAILQPSHEFVQRAVGHAILSLIMIDASIVLGYAGPYWACAILVLFAPAMLLAQWFKVT